MDTFLQRKRKSHTLEEDEPANSQGPSPVDDANATRAPSAKKPKATPKTKASKNQTDVGTCSLSKKVFGDEIKAALQLEKYGVQRMRINMEMDVAFFRAFLSGKGIEITPEVYDAKTSVVVAELNNEQAGEVFGVSKVKNGNRMVQISLQSMCVVFYPIKGRASAWVTV